MSKFAKLYKTAEVGQILVQAVKAEEMRPGEPPHVRFTFDHEVKGEVGRAILCSEMKYKQALKVVKRMTKYKAISTAMEMVEEIGEDVEYRAFVAGLEGRARAATFTKGNE